MLCCCYCFTLAETVTTFKLVLLVPTSLWAVWLWFLDVIWSLICVLWWNALGCHIASCRWSFACCQVAILLNLSTCSQYVPFCKNHSNYSMHHMNLCPWTKLKYIMCTTCPYLFMIIKFAMISAMCLQSQHHNVIVLHSQILSENLF